MLGPHGRAQNLRAPGPREQLYARASRPEVGSVSGPVTETWIDSARAMIRIELRSDNKAGLTVGPGFVTAELPR